MLVVCNKCRCSNQFGAIFCRNCGEKLAIKDLSHPDFNKSRVLRKVIGRILNVGLIGAIIALAVGLFLPVNKPEYNLDEKSINEVKKNCDALDIAYAKQEAIAIKFTPAEATFAANFMLDDARVPATPPPEPGRPQMQLKKQAGGGGVAGGNAFDQKQGAGVAGNNTFSQKQGTGLGAKASLSLPPSASAPPPPPPPPPPSPVSGADQGKPFLPKKEVEKEVLADPMYTSAYLVEIKESGELCISIHGKMMRYLPYKLELNGNFKYIEPLEKVPGRLTFELKSAKFGHLPVPSFLKSQIPDLVNMMVSDKKIRYYTDKITAIGVDNEGNIQVSIIK
jgi:hypothetical protein